MKKPPRDEQSLRAQALRAALQAVAARSPSTDPRSPRQPDPRSPPQLHRRALPRAAQQDRQRPGEKAPRREFERQVRHELFEAARFLYAIVDTGDCLRAARDFSREPALRLDRRSQLLEAIERAGGGPSFSDVGRALRVTRQAAREMILAAERAGAVELFTDAYDRRSLHVALTPSGRRGLERRRLPASDWTFTLLNGLPPESMRATAHVLGTLRERLRSYEKKPL
jgi:DNA-binding MarR family transcriptional regulator